MPIDKDKVLSMDGHSINIDLASTKDNFHKLERGIVEKLLGKRLPYFFLLNDLKWKWVHFGNFKLIMIAPDCFLCIFL